MGKEMQFTTNNGYYNIATVYEEPDEMCFIKEDLKTGDLTSFTHCREGSKPARSRELLADKAPPTRVQQLLDAVPTIKARERDSVMKRFGAKQSRKRPGWATRYRYGVEMTLFTRTLNTAFARQLLAVVEENGDEFAFAKGAGGVNAKNWEASTQLTKMPQSIRTGDSGSGVGDGSRLEAIRGVP
ncbi:MAG: hypothetical protein AAF585_28760 [Verrucomicrobiota bacterium]